MKKIALGLFIFLITGFQLKAQCTFESLFPLQWGASQYSINEYYNGNASWQRGKDTIRTSIFQHGLDYFFTVRNMDLDIFSYTNIVPNPCFKSAEIVMNCIANDSGLVAYNYMVTFTASRKDEFMAVLDSMRTMMKSKFTYSSAVEVKTLAGSSDGSELSGEGVCIYFNNHPIVSNNLTFPQFVVRGGYLAKKPAQSPDNKMLMNQAEEVLYYRIELLYKRPQPSWK